MVIKRQYTPRECFEQWIKANRPSVSLAFSESGEYESEALQKEWLSFAAGWAHRGQQV